MKAQNILREFNGLIVLRDFGTGVEFDEHAGITEPRIAGTPLYLAPEISSIVRRQLEAIFIASGYCSTSS